MSDVARPQRSVALNRLGGSSTLNNMPANKSQHFVPRCLLRPFTLGYDNKAINLFNLKLGSLSVVPL